MSRHRFHVATSLLPTMIFPCHDAKIQVATSPTATHAATSNRLSPISATSQCRFFHVATSLIATHVATSKMMSRHQAPPRSIQPCRNLKIQVATPSTLNQVATSKLSRDLKSAQPLPSQVATPFSMSRPGDFHSLSQLRSPLS